jgi:predicted nucleotidyltransferase
MAADSIHRKFTAALDSLVEEIKHDRSVLAAILCGSLSHDTVWEKSDIDLVLVTIDDKKVEPGGLSLYSDGVNVHAILMPRTQFRKTVEGSVRSSFAHSFLAKGRLLYTHDPTIESLCETLAEMGRRDRQVQLLRAGMHVLPHMDKARKWFVTRGDLDYTALWLLYAATPLAQVEVIDAGLLVDREVIPQAMRLNPAFFKTVYTDLLNSPKTREAVESALNAADEYVATRAATLFAPVLEHLQEIGEPRSCREIDDHFAKNFGVDSVTMACEYLADRGLLGKVSSQARLTKKSNIVVQELAFFHAGQPPR